MEFFIFGSWVSKISSLQLRARQAQGLGFRVLMFDCLHHANAFLIRFKVLAPCRCNVDFFSGPVLLTFDDYCLIPHHGIRLGCVATSVRSCRCSFCLHCLDLLAYTRRRKEARPRDGRAHPLRAIVQSGRTKSLT